MDVDRIVGRALCEQERAKEEAQRRMAERERRIAALEPAPEGYQPSGDDDWEWIITMRIKEEAQ